MSPELTWEAPGPGDWWLTLEHCPQPVCRLFSEIFGPATYGWKDGGEYYGLPTGLPQWGHVNHWTYYGPGIPLTEAELAARDETAAETLRGTPWREECRRWHEDERPQVVAANRALQAVDVTALDDDALLAHFEATIDNYLRWGPLHFAHSGFDVAAAMLFDAASDWEIEPAQLIELLGGNSPLSAAVDTHVREIADALNAVDAPPVSSLDDIRAASADANAALDAYLADYGWRPLGGRDLLEETIGERPEIVVAVVNAMRARPPSAPRLDAATTVRVQVPRNERAHFDTLLADVRAAYALRDDDVGVCWNWPMGLIRRAGLELGRRLVAREVVDAPEHLFEADREEVRALVAGGGPSRIELTARRARFDRASRATPPGRLTGDRPAALSPSLPPNVARLAALRNAVWSAMPARADGPLHGIGVGRGTAVGTARVIRHVHEFDRLEDGDILVVVATTTAFNAVFPLLAGVVTQTGGILSHAAILSRELDLPAVVGVTDIFDAVADGDVIEVDAAAGSVRVL